MMTLDKVFSRAITKNLLGIFVFPSIVAQWQSTVFSFTLTLLLYIFQPKKNIKNSGATFCRKGLEEPTCQVSGSYLVCKQRISFKRLDIWQNLKSCK